MKDFSRKLKEKVFGEGKSVTIETKIIHDTPRAVLIEHDGRSAWLSKRKLTIVQLNERIAKITIPKWLFDRKFTY